MNEFDFYLSIVAGVRRCGIVEEDSGGDVS